MMLNVKQPKTLVQLQVLMSFVLLMSPQPLLLHTASTRSPVKRTSLYLIWVVVLLMFLCSQSTMVSSKCSQLQVIPIWEVKISINALLTTSSNSSKRKMVSILKVMVEPSKNLRVRLRRLREIFPALFRLKSLLKALSTELISTRP